MAATCNVVSRCAWVLRSIASSSKYSSTRRWHPAKNTRPGGVNRSGRRERLNIWGNDYDTPDGTGVRDYIHVMDLAAGHVAALRWLDSPKCFAVNLGTGAGSSVLEVVKAFEKASGTRIPCDIKPRRPGDLDAYYAATAYASELLGWEATRTLETMCADHWRWQSTNPNGYA